MAVGRHQGALVSGAPVQTENATIAVSGNLSAAIALKGRLLSGVTVPAATEGTAMTFQGCDSATGTFLDVYDKDGNELSVVIGASKYTALDPTQFFGLDFVKVRTGTAASPTAQTGASATLKLHLRP